ncbi:hypothetical protein GCM10011383_36530 [Hymenobacter cavernae]|uniref:PA14 domain-containing protein n=2 Tax=Hymenobacter cavernae TaxID=2044852 RepID=A0ABQ1UNK1_9BACT|nr:hypothetical protein GCM10011383_36530 [Hymenobacter cavernae]
MTEVDQTEAAKFHNGGEVDGKNRPVDIAFVIDDTGSMSEEISSVINIVQRKITALSTSASGCGYVYQLITFKDAPNPRQPTTDLTVIRQQVAALVASGGGDCPEASVEAIGAVLENVKDNGTVFVATDAAPHAGVDLPGTIARASARTISISTILSGDCTPVASRAVATAQLTASPTEEPTPFSDNHDPNGSTTGGARVSQAAAVNYTALEAFSALAAETGGVFAYVPEINNGTAEGRARYESIGYGIISGGLSAAISLVQPDRVPLNSSLTLVVTGTKTNFNPSTTVTFNDAGIRVDSVRVVSPLRLEVRITVQPSATVGFKNLTATTTLPEGTETAVGEGLVQVTMAPSAPTILAISPAAGAQGQRLTVNIDGINTHFTNSSVLNLGPGILVLNTQALSATRLKAEIQIDVSAVTGFRNVVVTTGTEVATESVVGPFLVNILPSTPPTTSSCADVGSILREYWANVTGDLITDIPLASTPTQLTELNSFATPVNMADHYAERLRGYVCPPADGDYVFYIAGDNQAELWLSTDDDPTHKQKLAFVPEYTAPGDYGRYASQQSAPVQLLTGQRYYIEALHKEGEGDDHLSVGWRLPDNSLQRPIAGNHLVPFSKAPVVPPVSCTNTGSIRREYWANVPGDLITDIPLASTPSQVSQVSSFATPVNAGDRYAQRLRGYVCPPADGDYVFYIAGDNQAELWLSTDDDPTHKQKLAFVPEYTAPGDYGRYASQKSKVVRLLTGHRYYIEALHKEGAGEDHLSVGWQLPDNSLQRPIAGAHLMPFVPGSTAGTAPTASASRTDEDKALFIYPNPSPGTSTIEYVAPKGGYAVLEVYSMQGILVKKLFAGNTLAGKVNQVTFDGSKQEPGMYICKLICGDNVTYRRLQLLP